MPSGVPLTLSAEITAILLAATPPRALLEEALQLTLQEITVHTDRQDYHGRLHEGAARGNKLGRYLTEDEASWLAGRTGALSVLHDTIYRAVLVLDAGGRL